MLRWIEGFDQYGLTETFMLDGLWSQINNMALSTAIVRTGTHSMVSTGNVCFLRRQFGSALQEVGVGHAIYLDSLPVDNNRFAVCELRDAANAAQIKVVIQTTGAVAVLRGGVTLGTSAVLVTAAAWNHFEVYALIANVGGAVEVRLNGVTILNLTGIDTQETALNETSQVVYGSVISTLLIFYLDDLFTWDTTGTLNNTFIGDKKVYLLLPDADTADADWVPDTGGVGFSRINEVPPADDASYVEASNAGDISQFGLTDLPPEVVSVQGIYVPGRLRKTDAGVNNVQSAMVSGVSVASGVDRPITTAFTYWPDVFEVDPATSAPWTPAAVNASQLRFTRTA